MKNYFKIQRNEATTNLLCNIWIWSQLEQASCKAGSCLEVTEFEEEIQSCAQHQHHVDWLEVTVGEIRSHL